LSNQKALVVSSAIKMVSGLRLWRYNGLHPNRIAVGQLEKLSSLTLHQFDTLSVSRYILSWASISIMLMAIRLWFSLPQALILWNWMTKRYSLFPRITLNANLLLRNTMNYWIQHIESIGPNLNRHDGHERTVKIFLHHLSHLRAWRTRRICPRAVGAKPGLPGDLTRVLVREIILLPMILLDSRRVPSAGEHVIQIQKLSLMEWRTRNVDPLDLMKWPVDDTYELIIMLLSQSAVTKAISSLLQKWDRLPVGAARVRQRAHQAYQVAVILAWSQSLIAHGNGRHNWQKRWRVGDPVTS